MRCTVIYIYVLVMYIKFISQINLYARNVVISITQGITETYFDESRGDIVPLVLPTQLESEDSESECKTNRRRMQCNVSARHKRHMMKT